MTMQHLAVFAATLLNVTGVAAQSPGVVRSTGPGVWGSQLRLVQDLRIGQLEGDEAYTFGLIVAMTVGKDGAIFVGEANPARLRMYDANGRFVRRIGGFGGGPGEYGQINGLKTLPDGTIALWDGGVGRISLYSEKGEFRTSHRFHTGFFTSDMFSIDQSGNFYVKAQATRSQPGDFPLERPLVWIKLNSSGQVVDSIAIPSAPLPTVQKYGGPHKSRVEGLLAALSPLGYFVTGDPSRYAFELRRASQPLRVEREHRAVPVGRAEKAEWDAMADYLSKQPTGMSLRFVDGKRQTINGPAAKYEAPSVKPEYRALSVDDDGRIWVEPYVEAQQMPAPSAPPSRPGQPISTRPVSLWREPRTYDVFEPTGRFLGTVVAPRNTTFYVRRGRQIWATTRGEFDEQYIVRYRIQASAQ